MFDQPGGFYKQLQRLAVQGGGQASHAQLQCGGLGAAGGWGGNVRAGIGVGGQLGGLGIRCRLERAGVHGQAALQRQAQAELAFFGNAFLAAHQPGGAQAHLHVACAIGQGPAWRHGDGHGQ